MVNKIIKIVILLENILCVYRNTMNTGRYRMYLRLCIEVTMIFGCVYTYMRFMGDSCKADLILYHLNLSNSFIIIFIAWNKSQDFRHLLMLIERNNIRLESDEIYQRRVKNKLPRVIFSLILTFVCPFLIIWAQYIDIDKHYKNPYIYMVYSVCNCVCNIRYTLEYAVIYAFLYTLSELIKSVTRKLKKENVVVALIGVGIFFTNRTDNLKECTIIYKNIKECFRLMNAIFSLLFTVMLATVTIYFVIVVYGITFTGIKLRPSISFVVLTCSKFVYFFVPLYQVSSVAQTTQNSVDSLRRHIAHRLITLPIDDCNLKATRKFLQLVEPLKIQASGSIDIDMALIPKIIMFFTTYTVTALQFNNVI